MPQKPSEILILGGACIDLYEDPKNPGSFLPPKLGGDAANTAVRLATAAQYGWNINDVTLAALVGMQANEDGIGGQFIIKQLEDAGVQHDAGFQHDGRVREAVWRYDAETGRHSLNQKESYLHDPIELIREVPKHPSMPDGGIVLAASMATTLAWREYEHSYGENIMSDFNNPFRSYPRVVISSFNTRAIDQNETFERLGQKHNKREYYDRMRGIQSRESDIIVVSEDDLPHMYPNIENAKLFEQIKNEATGNESVLIISRGAAGFEIYLPYEADSIKISAPVVNGATVTVGAGGAALTGLGLGLQQLGVRNSDGLENLSRKQWQTIGQTMAAFSEYHIRQQNGENPSFPKPAQPGGQPADLRHPRTP